MTSVQTTCLERGYELGSQRGTGMLQESLLVVVTGSILFLPQTHLIKLGTKMLTLLPGEREPNIPFTQRRGTRQTSIASFVTLQAGMVPTWKHLGIRGAEHT